MELAPHLSSSSELNPSCPKKKYYYEEGQKNFFNAKRNQGKVAEIVHHLSIVEKLQVLKLCRNIFFSVKKEVDFTHCHEVMKRINKNDLDELNIKDIYDELSNYYEIHSKSEKTKELYAQNMLVFCAAMINKYYLEPGRFMKQEGDRKKFEKCFRKFDEDFREEWGFYNKKLDKFGLSVVANALVFNMSLKSLLIRGCSLDDQDVKLLLSSVDRNKTLDSLDLMYNQITNVGCKYIKEFLAVNKHLKRLAIGMNKEITEEGLEFICQGLVENTALETISLQGMKIEDSMSEFFKNVIEDNRSLTRIDLQNNKLTSISISNLKSALLGNNKITAINLFGNPLGDEGGLILADVIRVHPRLMYLELNGTGMTSKCGEKLLSAFKENKNVKYLQVLENFKDNKSILENFFDLNTARNKIS